MLKRTMDAAFVNAIANDPSVRPSLPGIGPVDFSFVVHDEQSVAFRAEGGAILFKHATDHGVFDVDIMFLRPFLGSAVKVLSRLAAAAMFDIYGAIRIDALTLANNLPARRLAKAIGFAQIDRQVRTIQGASYDLIYLSLTPKSFGGLH